VRSRRCPTGCYAVVLCLLCSAVCFMSSAADAGGVQFGFGVDVGPPVVVERTPPPPPVIVQRPPVPPPVVVGGPVMPPPVVVQRTAPPPPVVIQRVAPPPVIVEHEVPDVVYDAPVTVERRTTTTYYYYPAWQYRSYHVETQRDYYRQGRPYWEEEEY